MHSSTIETGSSSDDDGSGGAVDLRVTSRCRDDVTSGAPLDLSRPEAEAKCWSVRCDASTPPDTPTSPAAAAAAAAAASSAFKKTMLKRYSTHRCS